MDSTSFATARDLFQQGLQQHAAGRLDEAEASYRQSLQHLPGRPSTLTNLGAVLLKQGRAVEALPLLDQALQSEPDNAEALSHRALALADMGRDDDALQAFDKLLAAGLSTAAVHYHRALCLARLGRPDDALAAFDDALALDQQFAQAWARRGGLLKDMGRPAQAIASLQRGIDLGADVQVNGYLLAALTGTAAPGSAPVAYVQQLFDAYAGQFESHLVQSLDYRVPELLAQLVSRHGGPCEQALDLGCGTGLCAAPLKALVQRLHGVDLSAGMLDRARATGLYERVWQADIAEHLHATHERYALVVAADVFIYIGDLQAVFAGARRVLAAGGLFCFSAEQGSDERSYELRSSSRYAHSAQHLRALAAQQGFELLALEEATLRMDQQKPVAGLLVCLRSPARD
jgi:predicted TPR repeat methyltransferase